MRKERERKGERSTEDEWISKSMYFFQAWEDTSTMNIDEKQIRVAETEISWEHQVTIEI